MPYEDKNIMNNASNSSGQRIESLDIMKGIGIFLVCLGHCIPQTNYPLNRFLLAFHMPLFFFAAGFTASRSAKATPLSFLQKRVSRLLPPHLTLLVLTYVGNILISCILLRKKTITEVHIPGVLESWFIPTLFFCNLLMYGILRFSSKIIPLIAQVTFVILFCLIPSNLWGGGGV